MTSSLRSLLSYSLTSAAALSTIALIGCAAPPAGDAGGELADEAVGSSTGELTAFRCDGTDDVSHGGGGNSGSVRAVRASAHPAQGFDRFVMELEAGVSPDAYLVHRQRGTVFYGTGEDNSTTVQGVDGIAVIFMNSVMESTYSGPRRFTFEGGKAIKEVAQYDQFEGNDEWALGTQRNPCFRTFTLQSPPRLVVDVKR